MSSARLRPLLYSLLRSTPKPPALPPNFSTAVSPDSDLPVPASPPTQESVLRVLKKLDKSPPKALAFFNRITSQCGFKPAHLTYNLVLQILCHKDSMKDFWAFLKSVDDAGHTIDRRTYVTLLANFKKHKMTAESSALTQFYSRAMAKAACDAAIDSAAKLILGSEEWSEAVEKKLQDLNLSLSEIVVAKVLRIMRRFPSKALAFFRWAGQRPGYKHGSVAYNAMAWVLGREDSIGEFWSLVREMKGEGHEMDVDTYVKLSRRFQKTMMMREAVELYELMMDGPYKPAIQDCSVLLRRIARSGMPDLELVFRVVRKYEAAGYSLSKVLYDGIYRSLTSIGRFAEAEEILKRMKLAGYEPDSITYSHLVYGLCKVKRLNEACKVLDNMEADGCVPDLMTWTALIQGHCSIGEVDEALELLTKMIERNYEADANVLDVLVKGLGSKRRVDSAYTLVVEMMNTHVRPWQATFKYLIQELLSVRMLEEALKVLNSMKSHRFPPFADPFPPYIAKYGTIEDARDFLKALTVNNYPSSITYLHVFKSFLQEGEYSVDDAWNFQELQEQITKGYL
ncbi:pentatricopeptide repeat-containing protein At3g48250, chloroplastic-like [Phoenix dactylifera]|uniref:Pentatricopeptide repeat-containing protein At3g48250, chloroplastic-like n=1 Tax=Phoenix dactylifera TaxID=42345 RepID=A0A8B9AJI1_PHODC|nr:pentatricopeptide repeat-containing protein At3g48250, chloroplastic-like [Phoenix dactylifera]